MTKDEHTKLDTLIDFATSTNQDVKSVREDVKRVSEGQAELSKRFELHEQSDDHVHGGHAGRLSTLEADAEATGKHKVVRLEEQLSQTRTEAKKEADKWKGRLWAIFAVLAVAGFTNLVQHYLATR